MAGENSLSEQDVRAQLGRILGSESFANSTRLKDFLSYIVGEALAGRAHRIKGVTIAQSVFAADQSFDPETNSIVRVEAGRLRRRLSEYYAGSGRTDPILIGVPKGSYAPDFRPNPDSVPSGESDTVSAVSGRGEGKAQSRLALLASAVAVVAAAWVLFDRVPRDPDGVDDLRPETVAAPATESQVLFDQAFRILMPPEDRARMDAAALLFDRVVELSPDFAGGYAGKSLTHSIRVLFLNSDDPAADLELARQLGVQALDVDDEYALGFSALAVANALAEDDEQALQHARRALTAQNQGATGNAMAALALLVADHPREAIDLLEKAMEMNPASPRTPYLNLLGIAYYVTDDFERAAAMFEENLDRGGPTGPHVDVFLAVTYGRLGRDFEAKALVERLERTEPDYPATAWIAHYQNSPGDLAETVLLLRGLGWSGS